MKVSMASSIRFKKDDFKQKNLETNRLFKIKTLYSDAANEEINKKHLDQRQILYKDAMIFADSMEYQNMQQFYREDLNTVREAQLEEIRKAATRAIYCRQIYCFDKLKVGYKKGFTFQSNYKSLFEGAEDSRESLMSKLVSIGYSPEQLSNAADVLQHPQAFSALDTSIFEWLMVQSRRGCWNDRLSLLIIALVAAVGFGDIENLWRLMGMRNGMVFVVPYLVIYLLVCFPLLAFELTYGQIIRGGPPKLYNQLWKRARGLGVAMVIYCCIMQCIVYSRYPAEFLVYLVHSFKSPHPWILTADEKIFCDDIYDPSDCSMSEICIYSYSEKRCIANVFAKANNFFMETLSTTSKRNYLLFDYLDSSILASLTVSWVIITSFQLIGLSSFLYVAAAALILIVVLSMALLISYFYSVGAQDAIVYTAKSWNWHNLFSSSIWTECCNIVLYEFSLNIGIFSTLASHSRIGCNTVWETYEILAGKFISSTMLFAAAAAIVGHFSLKFGVEYFNIINLANNCLFIVFPASFQYSKQIQVIISILFYASNAILALLSISITLQVAIETFQDTQFFNKTPHWSLILPISIFFYICSIGMTTKYGHSLAIFFELYLGRISRIIFALAVSVLIGWCIGFDKQEEHLGFGTVVIFNSFCWLGTILGIMLRFLTNNNISYLWLTAIQLFFIALGTVIALFFDIILNWKIRRWLERKNIHSTSKTDVLPLKTRIWWLFLGNIELLRFEITRIVTGKYYWMGNLTVFWSATLKWFDCFFLTASLVDTLYDNFSSNEQREDLFKEIPIFFLIICFLTWIIMISAILFFFVFPERLFSFLKVPTTEKCDPKMLPNSPYNKLKKLDLLNKFSEFFQGKISLNAKNKISAKNKFLRIIHNPTF